MAITNVGLTGNGVVVNINDVGTFVGLDTLPPLLGDTGFLPWLGAGTRSTAAGRNLTGNDILTGGAGSDTLYGGAGSDQLHGNGGRNLLYGDGGPVFGSDARSIVRNGSFETFDLARATGNPDDYLRLAPGALANWTLAGSPDSSAELTAAGHGRGAPSDGKYWLDLGASPGDITATQEIGGLARGGIYVLRFDLAANPNQGERVEVWFDGKLLDTLTPTGGDLGSPGHSYTLSFEADDTGGALSFRNVGNNDNLGVGLDNVRLNALADAGAGAGDGNDTLTGGNDADTLVGGGGDDVIHGNNGNNRLYGGAGRDLITGGNNDDRV